MPYFKPGKPVKKKPVAKPTVAKVMPLPLDATLIAKQIWEKLSTPVSNMQNTIDNYYIERTDANRKNDRVLLIVWIIIVICYVILVIAALKRK